MLQSSPTDSPTARSPIFKVLYIHHGSGLGGAPLSLFYLIQKLDRSRYQPKVLFLYDSVVPDLFRNQEIDVRVLNTKWVHFSHSEVVWVRWYQPIRMLRGFVSWCVTAFIFGRKVLGEEKPDLIHLNSTPLSAWAYAAKSMGIPVVCHVREPIHSGYCGIRRFLLKNVLRKTVDRFIAISKHDAQRLGLHGRTKVVYNFVDFSIFDRRIDPTTVPGKTPNSKVVLYLGGDSKIKGFSVLIEALEFLNPDIILILAGKYSLNIYGKEGEKHCLRGLLGISEKARLYSKLTRSRNAHIIGERTDVPCWIAASDLVVFPSTVPHFARPIIEASAMAKPVIASQLEGMDELVIDGETGLMVPPGDPRSLAMAINQICANKVTAEAMGEAGYTRAKQLFDAIINASATFQVYDEILAKNEQQCDLWECSGQIKGRSNHVG
jgi:glycosyltransferase involved in cell wall biosynthesis